MPSLSSASHDITLKDNPKFNFFWNDVEVTSANLKLIKENSEIFQEALNQLKILMAL